MKLTDFDYFDPVKRGSVRLRVELNSSFHAFPPNFLFRFLLFRFSLKPEGTNYKETVLPCSHRFPSSPLHPSGLCPALLRG